MALSIGGGGDDDAAAVVAATSPDYYYYYYFLLWTQHTTYGADPLIGFLQPSLAPVLLSRCLAAVAAEKQHHQYYYLSTYRTQQPASKAKTRSVSKPRSGVVG